MRKDNLKEYTLPQLIRRFEEIGTAQEVALDSENTKKFNRLYDEMEAVDLEIRSRGTESRRGLLALYDHPSVQVRLCAAQYTYGVAPQEARAALKSIADSHMLPQAMNAALSVRKIDDGTTILD